MIKVSVYVYIFSVYTHDKDIITEAPSAPIFIRAPNEKNSEYTRRKEKERAGKGSRKSWGKVGTDSKGASSKKCPVSERDLTL